jgi:sugar-specific transcriptional regulator TrmB
MEILKNIGFSPDQIAIYKTLMEYGKIPASVIASRAKVSRVITYKILGQFVDMGIAEKTEAPKSIALFGPKDPEFLRKLIDQKKSEVESFSSACESAIATIKPQYNLLNDKPGIVFYEGLEGVKKVLEDSLYAQTEIYSFIDAESLLENFSEINREYVRKREKMNIPKKTLVADTPVAREYMKNNPNTTKDTQLLQLTAQPFAAEMQIYDNKISYITIGKQEGSLIGVIIEDERIANMHRYFFECLYELNTKKTLS